MNPTSSNNSNSACSSENTPTLTDLVLAHLKDKFPTSQFSAIPRFGMEIFIDGKVMGSIYGTKWFSVRFYDMANWREFYPDDVQGIESADPKFLDAVVYSATVAGGYL